MEILDTYTSDIQHKWEATETLVFYEFCHQIMEAAYKDVEYWETPSEPEYYHNHAARIIQQIETHIIASYLMLFKYPAHDALRFYEPISIYELFTYLHEECIEDELLKGIRNIMKGRIQQNMDHLSDYEKLIIVFAKSIVHYGLFFHHKNKRYFDLEFQEEALRYNRYFYHKVKRDIQAKHNQYSDEMKGNVAFNNKIVFRGEYERKKAVLYFSTLNETIFENGLFNDLTMFENFINCLITGRIDKDSSFKFNEFYIKKLLVHVFEIAKGLFKNNVRYGQLFFIKNTGQFSYAGKIVAGNNWQIENLNSDSEEYKMYTAAELAFDGIKALIPSEIDNQYKQLKISS